MRVLLPLVMLLLLLASPASAAFKGPSVSSSPVVAAAEAAKAEERTTCVLTGNITGHLAKDRYTFKDASGVMPVNIAPHVFGTLEVTPADTVRITGEIGGKKDTNRQDPHLRVRYIEIVK